jgi:hypothetical protein
LWQHAAEARKEKEKEKQVAGGTWHGAGGGLVGGGWRVGSLALAWKGRDGTGCPSWQCIYIGRYTRKRLETNKQTECGFV